MNWMWIVGCVWVPVRAAGKFDKWSHYRGICYFYRANYNIHWNVWLRRHTQIHFHKVIFHHHGCASIGKLVLNFLKTTSYAFIMLIKCWNMIQNMFKWMCVCAQDFVFSEIYGECIGDRLILFWPWLLFVRKTFRSDLYFMEIES